MKIKQPPETVVVLLVRVFDELLRAFETYQRPESAKIHYIGGLFFTIIHKGSR